MDETGSAGLAGGQEVESGLGDGLDEILLGDVTLDNALDRLDSLLGGLADGFGGSIDLDGEETGIGVGVVCSLGNRARSRGSSLGKESEAWCPLDGGSTTQEANEDSSLRLGIPERCAGEGDNHRVGASLGDALLAAKVLGSISLQLELGCGGNVLEEGLDPLGEAGMAGTVSNNGDVGLGVSGIGKDSDGVLVQVRGDGGIDGRVERGAEAGVEGDRVGGIEGNRRSRDLGLLQVDELLDLLVELESCDPSR